MLGDILRPATSGGLRMEVAKPRTILDGSPPSMQPQILMILLLMGSFLPALITNLKLLVRVTVGKSFDMPLSVVFPVGDPEFQEPFARELLSSSWPWLPVTHLGIFLLVVGGVAWYWRIANRERASPALLFLPALAPALVGLALAPLMVIPMIAALPEQGLTSPGSAGATLGYATRTVCAGLVLSLICFLGMLRSRMSAGARR